MIAIHQKSIPEFQPVRLRIASEAAFSELSAGPEASVLRAAAQGPPTKEKGHYTEDPNDPEANRAPRSARLNFDLPVSFEHEVLTFEELHPRLQECVRTIAGRRLFDWCDNMYLFVLAKDLASLLIKKDDPLLLPYLIGFRLLHSLVMHHTGFKQRQEEAVKNMSTGMGPKRQNSILSAFRRFHYPSLFPIPYRFSNELIRGIGDLISDLTSKGESPFAREDAGELLSAYHGGIIDNNFNLVLLKYPEAAGMPDKGFFMNSLLRTLWHFPLQRPKFRIQPWLRQRETAAVPANEA